MHHRSHDQWGSRSRGVCLGEGRLGRPPTSLPTGGWGGWVDPQSAYKGVGQTPRDTWDTMGYDQRVGGTHSTGMHSCCIWISMCGVLWEFFMNI